MQSDIADLETKTGFKFRLLTQRFPQTPGLAIKDYWGVDDNTIVLVADYFGGSGNLLKFNVGEKVYDKLPPRFWSVLAAKYGNTFFLKEKGEDQSIIQAFRAVRDCLLLDGCKVPPN
mmetsp:Transcript_1648/g.4420  ORF Transcript_1648/g.4420 Transcript_1648/m.4420 type:complete len:117 (-) Transcript_1648:104-454(-)